MTDELDALLKVVGKSGYLFHAFRGDRHGPDLLAAVRNWGGCADVLILFDTDTACAYRTPTGPSIDLFAPSGVYWWYAARPIWTLRAVLALPPPGHPEAPSGLANAPPSLGLPVEGRLPVRVRRRAH